MSKSAATATATPTPTSTAIPTAAGIPISESKASTGVQDPTDPEQTGDATVVVENEPDAVDLSDPANNGNIGYSADGQVVSNQQGEQANTSQATEEERAEVAGLRAAGAREVFDDPAVSTPHS